MVAFSSRGPTRDGRTKPDVVAPGMFILSTRSRRLAPSNNAWAPLPSSRDYFHMGGTSMATRLTADAVALLRQFLRVWVWHLNPSAALLKASLIAGATPVRAGAASERDRNDQGFGLVNIDAVVAAPAGVAVYFFDDSDGLRTGRQDSFGFTVRSSTRPLRITMAYSDYPSPQLVNNLNLLLIDPGGRYWTGNGRAPGWTLRADTRNNVEVVDVPRPRRGRWTLRVVGSSVRPAARSDTRSACRAPSGPRGQPQP